ncbi:MAG TPA: signal recognition particle-docking protein FtsY, partial [Sulfitobacter sp.]|nr:signal recognition particle-docking protein FtsY [Sulfitobacter sp.]
MAFFTKLKDRLFKSSSKIDEGLEAIVSDGGETEAEAAPVDAVIDQPGAASDVMPDGQDDSGPMLAAEQEEETPEPTPMPEPTPAPTPEPVTIPEPTPQPAPAVPPEPADPEPTPEPEQVPPAVDPVPTPAPDPAPAPDEVPPAVDLRQAMTPVAPALDEAEAAPAKPGLLGRLMGRSAAQPVVRRALDDEMLEQLEELLISADMGVDTALRVTANMAEGRFGKKLSVAEIKQLLASEVSRIMEPVARPLPIYSKTPQVVLVVGVNGSGKTTTIGKLASQFRAAGKKVVIAAGDTFRAAAVEQLQVWGERAGVPVLTAAQGSDPASLAFDAMGRAQEEGADLLLIDTAGRLQNRGDLMEELAKIVRVIRK